MSSCPQDERLGQPAERLEPYPQCTAGGVPAEERRPGADVTHVDFSRRGEQQTPTGNVSSAKQSHVNTTLHRRESSISVGSTSRDWTRGLHSMSPHDIWHAVLPSALQTLQWGHFPTGAMNDDFSMLHQGNENLKKEVSSMRHSVQELAANRERQEEEKSVIYHELEKLKQVRNGRRPAPANSLLYAPRRKGGRGGAGGGGGGGLLSRKFGKGGSTVYTKPWPCSKHKNVNCATAV